MSSKNAHWITWFVKCHITIVLVKMLFFNHLIYFFILMDYIYKSLLDDGSTKKFQRRTMCYQIQDGCEI